MILQSNSADILLDTLKKSAEIHVSPKIAEINVITPRFSKNAIFQGNYIRVDSDFILIQVRQLKSTIIDNSRRSFVGLVYLAPTRKAREKIVRTVGEIRNLNKSYYA